MTYRLTDTFTESELQQISQLLLNRQYHLILGAGASVSSYDSHRRNLPTSSTLTAELAKFAKLPKDTTAGITTVYQMAKKFNHEETRKWLVSRFVQTRPAAHYDNILELPWNTIWTLNIDDCIERAAIASKTEIQSYAFDDLYRERETDKTNLVVHLHGKASHKNASKVIFSLDEYKASIKTPSSWIKIFEDQIPNKPTIIIGATLTSEADIAPVLQQRYPDSNTLSIIVNKTIDDEQKLIYESMGLRPVEADVADFLEELQRRFDQDNPAWSIDPQDRDQIAEEFHQQWQRLSSRTQAPPDAKHDIYIGHTPAWADALAGFISKRQIENDIEKYITDSAQEIRVATIFGPPFSGKTATTLSIARACESNGYECWLARHEVAPSPEAVIHRYRSHPKTILFIDDGEDFSRDISSLIDQLGNAALAVRIVLSERTSRSQHVLREIPGRYRKQFSISDDLRRQEIEALLETLRQNRRLGKLTRMTSNERRTYFDRYDHRIFSAMADIEAGSEFSVRAEREILGISERPGRTILRVCAIVNSLSLPLPIEIAARSTNLAPYEVRNAIDHELSDLVAATPEGGIELRQRRVADSILNVEKEKLADCASEILRSLAPYVSRYTIAGSPVHTRLAVRLMQFRTLLTFIPENVSMLAKVYEDSAQGYAWNARFWEQRALFASHFKLHEKATSWAEEAVHRLDDVNTRTTAGKVYGERAIGLLSEGHGWPYEYLDSTLGHLEQAMEVSNRDANPDYPLVTFFALCTRLFEAARINGSFVPTSFAPVFETWQLRFLAFSHSKTVSPALGQAYESACHAWDVQASNENRG